MAKKQNIEAYIAIITSKNIANWAPGTCLCTALYYSLIPSRTYKRNHKRSIMGVKGSKLSRLIAVCGAKSLRGRHPFTTPRGYIPIAVGVNNETKRFMVHTAALGDADFMELLCVSAEEYGFCNEGILKVRYEAQDFEDWLIKGAKQKMFRVKPT